MTKRQLVVLWCGVALYLLFLVWGIVTAGNWYGWQKDTRHGSPFWYSIVQVQLQSLPMLFLIAIVTVLVICTLRWIDRHGQS